MSKNNEVWSTLSKINVSEFVEKKGQLTYLSWAWAWGVFMDNYPLSRYEFKEPVLFADGSCEVWCTVTVVPNKPDQKDIAHTMWLPVMDNRNRSVKNPDARAISDTRMRCLTKCLAMHGLGHYIYAGEDLPKEQEEDVLPMIMEVVESKTIEELKENYLKNIKLVRSNESKQALVSAKDNRKKEIESETI